MPETIDLPDGHTAEIRVELTGADQRWFLIEREKLIRANGSGSPGKTEPDPDNPAIMKETPAVPADLTMEDNFTLLDMLAAKLLVSSTMPGVVPWTAATRDTMDLDVVDAIDVATIRQRSRLLGTGPKRRKNSAASATTSGASEAAAPQPAQTPEPSSTPPG